MLADWMLHRTLFAQSLNEDYKKQLLKYRPL